MKTLLTSCAILALVALFTAPASAEVLWDGSGDPTATGNYALVPGSGMSGIEGYTFDSPSAGFMQQDTSGYSGVGSFNRFMLSSAKAASELSNAAGWKVETRVQTLANTGDYFGMYFAAEDNVGGLALLLHPTSVDVYSADFSTYPTPVANISLSDSGYHAFALKVAPGASSGHVWVDGVDSATVTLAVNAGSPAFTFGDGSSGSAGQASWDYVNINAVPEPSSLALLAGGLLGLLCYAWRKQK
jgi:hypothetical protein